MLHFGSAWATLRQVLNQCNNEKFTNILHKMHSRYRSAAAGKRP